MLRRLYAFLLWLLTPLILLFTLWRAWRRPPYRAFLWQRFGFVPPRRDRPLWIHAVSVGEGIAALPLIRALQARYPALPILLTSTTPTGRALLRERLGDSVTQLYLPYDTPGAVGRFLRRQQPRLGLFLETEIWPNLFQAAQRQQIPLFLLNARLSTRSLRGYARWRGLFAPALAALEAVAAQSEADAGRFRALGAPRVEVLGQLKLDLQIDPQQRQQGEQWRAEWDRPVWAFVSTHAGEEALAAEILARLQTHFPELLLLLIPRHPERAAEILGHLSDFRVVQRSRGEAVGADTEVYLVDTLGEVIAFCAAADVVSMGGSFVPHGGHNPLEPAALGKPVLVGLHMENFQSLTDTMLAAGALLRCPDNEALYPALLRLLQEEADAAALGDRAATWVAGQTGALERTLGMLGPYLER